MRIGVMAGATPGPDGTLDGIVARAQAIEAAGFHSMWMANIFGLDAITSLAIVGRETERIELGTAVVPPIPVTPRRSPSRRSPPRPPAGAASCWASGFRTSW